MPEGTFTVVAKSAYGIKIKQDGPWWNFTKPEFRGERFNTSVKKGDRVQVEYQEKEYSDPETGERLTKYFISAIDLVTRRETDDPFPPEEDFPPDDAGAPLGPTLDKDRLIVRQVCVKAACEALAVSGLEPEEKAGRITYLAGILEDWIYRD